MRYFINNGIKYIDLERYYHLFNNNLFINVIFIELYIII
jgi:predicted aldo/keto reductase-like oxidoreductase